MRITLNKLEEQINNVNENYLSKVSPNLTIKYYQPDYFPGVIILKNGKPIFNERQDGIHYAQTKTEVFTALVRVIKFIDARDRAHTKEHGEKLYYYISDEEICGIFAAAFWR